MKTTRALGFLGFLALLFLVGGVAAQTCGAGGACGAAAGACPTGGACTAAVAPEAKVVESAVINPAGVDALIKAKTGVVVLDARSGKYDDGRRVPGAKSLNAASTAAAVAKVIASKSSLVVTYCSNPKCPASGKLAKHLASLGYTNILEMPQGIEGWVAEGRPTETVK